MEPATTVARHSLAVAFTTAPMPGRSPAPDPARLQAELELRLDGLEGRAEGVAAQLLTGDGGRPAKFLAETWPRHELGS